MFIIGLKGSLKNFFTFKKNNSIEKISCYNKKEYYILKTISYSIVCFSNKIIEMEEEKKKKNQ